ncbi:uncharacterized protein [Primulina huaijiensis]|uniref:uncharacterized protein isoform X1 n=1 Tax=Primulina huaijiensis TaxID=1492673 RepID=UPI003CC75E93
MGIIEDGTTSGNLPSSSKVFAVHYPGYPSSIERAVETLGGTEGILKVCTKKLNRLELHFRPEDPYSHPAFGELQPCNNFLLKISKKKVKSLINKNNPGGVPEHASAVNLEQNNSFPKLSETSQKIVRPESELHPDSSEVDVQTETGAHETLFADIVAQVSEAYHFNGMVDYQHVLAVHADNARRKKRNWDEDEPQFRKGVLLDFDHEDLMMVVPPLFSTKDLPENVVLKPCSDPSLKRKQEVVMQQRWEMEIEQCLAIDFNIKDILIKVYWEKFIPRDSERWQWQTAVCELFDERPIWVKESLAERLIDRGLNVGGNVLKRLLFIAAYYFSNGPFLRFWVKKGYDPRKDPESRIYQKTDFRVPPLLRSYCDANASSGLKNNWKDICAFEVFPSKCQVLLQLFELKDDYVQQEIKKPSSQESCSLQTGWFSSHVIDCLRLRVAQRFLTVYPEIGAESILKSVSRRFERSKKVQINLKDLKGDEGKQANEDIVQSVDKEPIDEVEYDEDEMEEDNLGEGFDAAEVLIWGLPLWLKRTGIFCYDLIHTLNMKMSQRIISRSFLVVFPSMLQKAMMKCKVLTHTTEKNIRFTNMAMKVMMTSMMRNTKTPTLSILS